MAASPKKTGRSADEWLIGDSEGDEPAAPKTDGTDDPLPDDHPKETAQPAVGAETAQWLVEPATDRNGGSEMIAEASDASFELPAAAPEPKPETPSKSSRSSAKSDQAVKKLRAENRELAKRIYELQAELKSYAKQAKAEIAKALKDREADLTTRFEEREEKLRERIDQAESALAEAQKAKDEPAKPRKRRAAKKEAALDLNSASFEDLRNLGLSITQSARVIAYRDTRGGYESLDELDEIPGLPKGMRLSLRRQVTLSS